MQKTRDYLKETPLKRNDVYSAQMSKRTLVKNLNLYMHFPQFGKRLYVSISIFIVLLIKNYVLKLPKNIYVQKGEQ